MWFCILLDIMFGRFSRANTFFLDHFYTQAPTPNQINLGMEAQVLAPVFSSPLEPLCIQEWGPGRQGSGLQTRACPRTAWTADERQSLSFCQSGWGLQICIPNRFPGDAAAAGTTCENH